MGDKQSIEVAPPGLDIQQVKVIIRPQNQTHQEEKGLYQQQCSLLTKYYLYTRRFPLQSQIQSYDRVRRDQPIWITNSTVIKSLNDSVLIELESSKISATKQQQLLQLEAIIVVLGMIMIVYIIDFCIQEKTRENIAQIMNE